MHSQNRTIRQSLPIYVDDVLPLIATGTLILYCRVALKFVSTPARASALHCVFFVSFARARLPLAGPARGNPRRAPSREPSIRIESRSQLPCNCRRNAGAGACSSGAAGVRDRALSGADFFVSATGRRGCGRALPRWHRRETVSAHPETSCPASCRASTQKARRFKGVDGRNKSGHDVRRSGSSGSGMRSRSRIHDEKERDRS